MTKKDGLIDARLDVFERRILAHGTTPEEWAVEVAQTIPNLWVTTFHSGSRSFQLAEGEHEEGEQHCMFVGRMFAKVVHFWNTYGEDYLTRRRSNENAQSERRPTVLRETAYDRSPMPADPPPPIDPFTYRDKRELAAAKAAGFPTAPCVCCGAIGVVGYAGKGRAGCERCITGRCPKGNVSHADW
jgi:hypothetical protein